MYGGMFVRELAVDYSIVEGGHHHSRGRLLGGVEAEDGRGFREEGEEGTMRR